MIERPLVIARCYRDEPVVMEVQRTEAVNTRGNRFVFILARPGARTTISWPPAYAVEYSPELFAELFAAYANGDVGRLYALWDSAPPAPMHPEMAPVPAVDPSRSTPAGDVR